MAEWEPVLFSSASELSKLLNRYGNPTAHPSTNSLWPLHRPMPYRASISRAAKRPVAQLKGGSLGTQWAAFVSLRLSLRHLNFFSSSSRSKCNFLPLSASYASLYMHLPPSLICWHPSSLSTLEMSITSLRTDGWNVISSLQRRPTNVIIFHQTTRCYTRNVNNKFFTSLEYDTN